MASIHQTFISPDVQIGFIPGCRTIFSSCAIVNCYETRSVIIASVKQNKWCAYVGNQFELRLQMSSKVFFNPLTLTSDQLMSTTPAIFFMQTTLPLQRETWDFSTTIFKDNHKKLCCLCVVVFFSVQKGGSTNAEINPELWHDMPTEFSWNLHFETGHRSPHNNPSGIFYTSALKLWL